jgi:hypothetical protein
MFNLYNERYKCTTGLCKKEKIQRNGFDVLIGSDIHCGEKYRKLFRLQVTHN